MGVGGVGCVISGTDIIGGVGGVDSTGGIVRGW